MENQREFRWDDIREELKETAQYLKGFAKNPLGAVRQLPDWRWPTILLLQTIITVVSGFATGIFAKSPLSAFLNIFTFPFISTLGLLIFSGLIYYSFLFFRERELPFRQLFVLLVLANIPVLASLIVSVYIAPFILIGVAFAVFILVVGLVDYFRVDKKFSLRLLIALYALFLAFWIMGQIRSHQMKKELYEKTSPETLDILQKEFEEE